MRRVLVIAASSIALAACTGTDFPKLSWPSFDMPNMTPAPATSTIEFESEPAGAEVKTSTGQICRTPCALSVSANELTATFALPGYQPQTIPVRMIAGGEGRDPMTGQVAPPRMTPNPVFAELVVAPPMRRAPPPPPAAATKPVKKKPKVAKPKPPASTGSDTGATPMTATPSAPPASPWPAPSVPR